MLLMEQCCSWNNVSHGTMLLMMMMPRLLFTGYEIEAGGLSVLDTEPSDAGIYICMAQNNAGTALGQVRLQVQGGLTLCDPSLC
jgi:hypothetical protein